MLVENEMGWRKGIGEGEKQGKKEDAERQKLWECVCAFDSNFLREDWMNLYLHMPDQLWLVVRILRSRKQVDKI